MNLYFAYLFVLRAVMKAAPVLTAYEYSTGLQQEDAQTQQLITQLVSASWVFSAPLWWCKINLCTAGHHHHASAGHNTLQQCPEGTSSCHGVVEVPCGNSPPACFCCNRA
eukprot:GHUV01036957.1.p2 GENE.GHUV01036957.1~~GHUV01036957.1.p2  ORF type:complete len:110 (-),score=12.32 GHUV01036957.1:504-833(-)